MHQHQDTHRQAKHKFAIVIKAAHSVSFTLIIVTHLNRRFGIIKTDALKLISDVVLGENNE
jgi:hypothetical protein